MKDKHEKFYTLRFQRLQQKQGKIIHAMSFLNAVKGIIGIMVYVHSFRIHFLCLFSFHCFLYCNFISAVCNQFVLLSAGAQPGAVSARESQSHSLSELEICTWTTTQGQNARTFFWAAKTPLESTWTKIIIISIIPFTVFRQLTAGWKLFLLLLYSLVPWSI